MVKTGRFPALSAPKTLATPPGTRIALTTRKIKVIQASHSKELLRRFGNYGLTPLDHIEICETPTALVLTAQIPPIPLAQIHVQLTAKTLQITGEILERARSQVIVTSPIPASSLPADFGCPKKCNPRSFRSPNR
jgi:HSP20 family molecular chaperone IbpA